MAEIKLPKTIHLVKGYLFPPFLTEKWLETAASVFKPRDTDIFVVSYSKSGTHWLSHIAYLLKKKEKLSQRYLLGAAMFLELPHVDKVEIDVTNTDVVSIVTEVPDVSKLNITKETLAALPDPRFFFTHFPYEKLPKNPATKYFYIYRNPKDIVVSLFHHFTTDRLNSFVGAFDEFFRMYMDNNCFNYCEQMRDYIEHKDDPNLFVLSYEELQAQFKVKVNEIATFLEVDLTEELFELVAKETNFETMRENNFINGHGYVKEGINFFPKGKVGTWKASLSEEQSNKMDEFLLAKLGKDFVKKHITFSLT